MEFIIFGLICFGVGFVTAVLIFFVLLRFAMTSVKRRAGPFNKGGNVRRNSGKQQ